MRGSCSPIMVGITRLAPMAVRATSMRLCSAVTWPMRAASLPSGCARKNCQHAIGGFGRDEEDRFAFVGHVHRIEAEQLACRLHFRAHGKAALVDSDADIGGVRNFIQRGSEAAARGVAHGVDCRACRIEDLGNHAVQRGAIGADLALELEALAHAHDGHAVVADGSRDEDRVAGLARDADQRRCPGAGRPTPAVLM